MPLEIDGEVYYWTLELCRKAHISRSTLVRMLDKGVLPTIRKDRRGWRVFTEMDLGLIRAVTNKIYVEEVPRSGRERQQGAG